MTEMNPGTPRLQLDPPVPADRDAVFAIASDPRTWAHIPGARSTDPARVEATLEMFGTGWREHGLSHWVVRLGEGCAIPGLEPGRVLGTGGVHLFESEAGGRIWNLGYRLDPACWGHGFASELARTAVACAGEKLAEVPVIARVLSTNPASARVAAKAGLELQWTGEASEKTRAAVGRESVQRLIFADRELEPGVLGWLVSRG
ncbi:MAG: GNAT family N-acetyltransferase [Paeniglutamicibacter sp.]